MSPFDLTALFLVLVAVAGWVNLRTFQLPHAVVMLLVGLAAALALTGLAAWFPEAAGGLIAAVRRIDFAQAVLGYMLAFLLFAGAMQVDLAELRRRRLTVFALATVGVAVSTVLVGGGIWLVARWLGTGLTLPWALVFGALISPTDPIAVLATVKRGDLSKTVQVILQGEALFNDGVGIVVFTALVAVAGGASPSAGEAIGRVAIEAAGGLALGLAAGFLVLRAMRAVDDFVVEVILTVALAMGVYALAGALHLSGPIAVVGAGLLVGDQHGSAVMSQTTQTYLRGFWTLVDEILNGLLFLLLGVQIIVIPWERGLAAICAAATALVLLSRFLVVLPWGAQLRLRREENWASVVLAWGGLHGALSLALALSIPDGPYRTTILAVTYVVAAFSVVVQGLTFAPLAGALRRRPAGA